MDPQKNTYERLVAKYLTGNCSENEQKLVLQWLDMSDANKEYFEQCKKIWEVTPIVAESVMFSVEPSLKLLNRRIEKAQRRVVVNVPLHSFSIQRVLRYAVSAAAVLVIGIVFFFLRTENKVPENLTYTAVNNQNSPYLLPDGTSIYMDNGSIISYPARFVHNKRTVGFTGDALFDVISNPEKPFNIVIGNLGIEVLGTTFNLSAMPGSETITLDLITGKVRFYTFDTVNFHVLEQMIILPGQRGTYSLKTAQISRTETPDQNFLTWKTGVLEFVNTPLIDVVHTLEQMHHLSIQLNPSYNELKLTARFENEQPDSVLHALQTIFDFEMIKNGNSVIIR
jgi:ferric-dicitrate binding protein FerR (iron transport regulator)